MADKMLKAMALAAILLTSVAEAQSLNQIGGPANPPPAGFRGQQFVDSRGCLFLRAGYGAGVNWVARVDRTRKPICNMMPTGNAAALAAVEADMAPEPRVAAQMAPVAQSVARPMPVAQATAVAVQAPVRQVAAPSPAPQPRVFVREATPKANAPAPMRQASAGSQVPSYQGVGVATSVAGVECYQGAPVLERVTVSGGSALICTRGDGSASGWRPPLLTGGALVAAQTVPVVQVPVYQAPASVAAQVAPVYVAPQPVTARSRALPKPPKGWVYAWKDDRLNPLRGAGTVQGQAQQDQVWQSTIPLVLVTEAPPQTALQRALGIRPVATPKATVSTTVSTMSTAVAAPVATGGHMVQVGSFAVASNAQAVVARLSSLGLPVSTARTTRKGKVLQVVYAGPFRSGAEAHDGLSKVHSAGYSDAILR